jgi:hypothetical protein
MTSDARDRPARRPWDDADVGREAFRARTVEAIPSYYRPWLHLAGTTLPGLTVLVLALASIHDLRAVELLVVPLVFAGANLFEWHAHRNLLHRRWRPLAVLYDRHTPVHHRIYRYGDMAIRATREFRVVLIPAAGVAGVVALSAPIGLLVGQLVSRNAGWLFFVTASLYMVSYELSHLSYHLPPDTWVGRRALVRVLREHHARHHDPRLMQRWNFNVTVPLADWLLGTIAPPPLVAEARTRAAEPWRGEQAAPPRRV